MMQPERLAALNDPLLQPLLAAADAQAREREMERLLVTVTQPLVERIVWRYARTEGALEPQDLEDIRSTVDVRVIRRLRAALESEEEAIRDLADYVATLTYNVIHDELRRRHPLRTRLKNRLRYALTHDRRLALWETAAGWLTGLAGWRDLAPPAPSFDRGSATPAMRDSARPADALVALFESARAPLLFRTLVDVAAELWAVADPKPLRLEAVRHDDAVVARLEHRQFLAALWREVLLLPPQQRKALLLNLRDDESVHLLSLFALTATTTFDEVAEAMEMTAEELAEIWNDLPLDDLRIGRILDLSRQQVINLRKAARQRLGRRLFGRKS